MPAQLVLALDNLNVPECEQLVDEVSSIGVRWFKVGLELYTQTGPQFVAKLKAKNLKVFLDLKLYDIPNTVSKAVSSAVNVGADLLTVHASGGRSMLEAAKKASEGSKLSVVGVTVLTSFSDRDFNDVAFRWGSSSRSSRVSTVQGLATLVADCGLPGIVCSVPDLKDLQLDKLWRNPVFVTPGIRNAGGEANDQAKVATPEDALSVGATHLVVGRPITGLQGAERLEAARRFHEQIQAGSR